MSDVIDAALRYPVPRGGRVTFEYVLLGGVNDTPAPRARARPPPRRAAASKVNLIPLNPAPEIPFEAPQPDGGRRLRRRPRRGRRRRVGAAPARPGHPRRLRPAPPQEGATARPPRAPLSQDRPLPQPLRAGARGASSPALAGAPPAGPRPGAARAGRDLLPRRGAGHGRERRLAGAALPGPAVLRQAGAHVLADGRVDGRPRADPAPAARLVPVARRARRRSLATAWLGTLLFDRRSALAGRARAGHDARLPLASRGSRCRTCCSRCGRRSRSRLARARLPRRAPPAWTVPLLGAVAGLGFATKGPIALLVPGARDPPPPLGAPPPPAAARRRGLALRRARLRRARPRLVRARLPARMGAEPLVYFFLRENLERFAGEAYDVGRPLWFYPPAYLAEGLPWSPFLPDRRCGACCARGDADDAARRRASSPSWVALVLVPSQPLAREDRLLPAAALPRRSRSLVGRYLASRPVARARPGAGPARVPACSAAAALGLAARAPAARARTRGCPVPARGRLASSAVLVAAVVAARCSRPLRPDRRARGRGRSRPRPSAAAWLVLVAFFLPAFAARPAQPRDREGRRARAAHTGPDLQLAVCADPSRARRDVLLHARLTRASSSATCGAWPASRAAVPPPRHPRAGRVAPRAARATGTIATLPLPAGARAHARRAALGARAGEIVLGANFRPPTRWRSASSKREYRKAIQKERAQAREALRTLEAGRGRARRRGQSPERLGRRAHGRVDLRLAVGERDERRLELRGRQVDAALEHRVEEAAEARRVGAPSPRRSPSTGPAQKKTVIIEPTRLIVTVAPASPGGAAQALPRAARSAPRAPRRCPASRAGRGAPQPAAIASGLPESVPAW